MLGIKLKTLHMWGKQSTAEVHADPFPRSHSWLCHYKSSTNGYHILSRTWRKAGNVRLKVFQVSFVPFLSFSVSWVTRSLWLKDPGSNILRTHLLINHWIRSTLEVKWKTLKCPRHMFFFRAMLTTIVILKVLSYFVRYLGHNIYKWTQWSWF